MKILHEKQQEEIFNLFKLQTGNTEEVKDYPRVINT
jgi:hypothetical protein